MGAPGPVAEAGPRLSADAVRGYAAITDEPFPVDAVEPRDLKARNVRVLIVCRRT